MASSVEHGRRKFCNSDSAAVEIKNKFYFPIMNSVKGRGLLDYLPFLHLLEKVKPKYKTKINSKPTAIIKNYVFKRKNHLNRCAGEEEGAKSGSGIFLLVGGVWRRAANSIGKRPPRHREIRPHGAIPCGGQLYLKKEKIFPFSWKLQKRLKKVRFS